MGSQTKFHLVAEHLLQKTSIDATVFLGKFFGFENWPKGCNLLGLSKLALFKQQPGHWTSTSVNVPKYSSLETSPSTHHEYKISTGTTVFSSLSILLKSWQHRPHKSPPSRQLHRKGSSSAFDMSTSQDSSSESASVDPLSETSTLRGPSSRVVPMESDPRLSGLSSSPLEVLEISASDPLSAFFSLACVSALANYF